ncbi:MAG: acyl-CoA thioesterase [Aquificae bacterium]|nr:acyl-CoA thioesterase [Aquificota bacterium]
MLYTRRVQFYDTDAQGVVHHSNYFRYFEEARGEFLRELGFPYSKMRELGYEVVLLEACANFKKPLLYDEVVCINLNLESMDRFTFTFSYRVEVEGELRAEGKTKHCVVKEGKIVSIPQEIREKLGTERKA